MSESTPSAHSLGSTARWTASVRAKESEREDCLFFDPWASALAGPEGASWIATRSADSVVPIVLRTRYFDDFLQRITGREKLQQVVLMAAGLDTRAFRLSWSKETHVYELDQALVLEEKERILGSLAGRPRCQRVAIPADLTDPWQDALLAGGFDPRSPSVWLLEGFLFYLATEHVTRILDEVTELAAVGSWLGFDIINGAMLTSPLTRRWIEMQAESGAPWVGILDNPVEFLAARGWQATLSQAGAEDANFGRWPFPVLPVTMPDVPHNWYVTAQKVE